MNSIVTNVEVQVATPAPQSPTIPSNRIIGRFKHDFELDRYDKVPRSLQFPDDKLKDTEGFPEMVPFFFRDKFTPMTESIQWFWFNQMMLTAFGHTNLQAISGTFAAMIINAWRGMTKGHTAFCNGKGTDTCWDFIRNINEDTDLPGLSNLSCGGNVIELISRNTISTRGSTWYRIKVLDGKKAAPSVEKVNRKNTPYLISVGVNSTPLNYARQFSRTGPWRADPMHYLSSFGEDDCPFPLYSLGGAPSARGYDEENQCHWVEDWVQADRVEILEAGSPYPRPYAP